MWMIIWRGEARVMIGSLDMCGGVYMRQIFCSCLCLSSIDRSWWGGNNVFLLRSRYLIRWRGMFRSTGYSDKVVYLGLISVRQLFCHKGSVPWCDWPTLRPRAWVYCGGAIVCRRVSRFVWWVGWTILVPFFASDVSEIRLLCTCEGYRNDT